MVAQIKLAIKKRQSIPLLCRFLPSTHRLFDEYCTFCNFENAPMNATTVSSRLCNPTKTASCCIIRNKYIYNNILLKLSNFYPDNYVWVQSKKGVRPPGVSIAPATLSRLKSLFRRFAVSIMRAYNKNLFSIRRVFIIKLFD